LTLHRPVNVDSEDVARPLLAGAAGLAHHLPVVFPMHPRTRKSFAAFGLLDVCGRAPNLQVTPPLGYLDMLSLVRAARLVLTDSGGLQEETSYPGVPCLTLRDRTERPYTVTHGRNRVIGTRPARLLAEARCALDRAPRERRPIPLWDGRADRIIDALAAGARSAGFAPRRSARRDAALPTAR
jgi:UDP-N-acetylglucosamine 2-epimerase (non-hydrolysing)